ncbi:MAG: sel1 repeat family protein, partial [Proteobacteria bacterium]|nr:sel1 repeat family protein [Pseudomonadota bacterium]
MKNLDSNGFGKRPDPQNVDKEVLRLWNPTAAILWGLLFSPAFSALLHSKNWAALGKEDKAKESMQWAISGIVIILLLTFSDVLLGIKIPDAVGNVFPLIYLGSWYFPLGREQSKYLKNEIDGNYKKRGWFKPIIIATVAMFIFFQLILLTVNPIGNADISDKTKVGLNKEVSKEITEKRVFEILKNKVNKGNATANEHYALGYIYENGIGVPVDYKKAMKQYKLSAKQGDAKSQALLGYKYYKGKSTPVDYKKAMKWFKLSAEQGNANAQGMLGSIYY